MEPLVSPPTGKMHRKSLPVGLKTEPPQLVMYARLSHACKRRPSVMKLRIFIEEYREEEKGATFAFHGLFVTRVAAKVVLTSLCARGRA